MSTTDTAQDRPIRMTDGVFVHGWMIWQGDGTWWAYRGFQVMFATDRDDLLLQIADATNHAPDLDDLRGRLERSIDRSALMRLQEEAVARRSSEGQGRG